ncbi:MAG: sugar phosphate isomerase/epimerase [Sedimentisphaerales bacterium]|nr:sugar phosphate isomerase/epimerase [Sedimentisphaerales bacterium]
MEKQGQRSRREFFKWASLGAAASALPDRMLTAQAPSAAGRNETAVGTDTAARRQAMARLDLGVASYTFRKWKLPETLKATRQLDLKYIAFKSFHLALDSSPGQIEQTVAAVKQAGCVLYGGGVIYMNSADEVRQGFDYARTAGMKVIIGVPKPELLDLVEQKVKEYDIQLAIHNHGPGDKVYPTPQSAYDKIKDRDRRIGLCIDIGHTQRAGVDPAESTLKLADRILDVHIKDVSAATAEGHTVEVGRGVIDIPRFLQALLQIRYRGKVSFEYEKDEDNPLPGLAESVGYCRGVLTVI